MDGIAGSRLFSGGYCVESTSTEILDLIGCVFGNSSYIFDLWKFIFGIGLEFESRY